MVAPSYDMFKYKPASKVTATPDQSLPAGGDITHSRASSVNSSISLSLKRIVCEIVNAMCVREKERKFQEFGFHQTCLDYLWYK